MKKSEKFISSVINEASLDSRIPDGVINLENIDHVIVLAETMYNQCGDAEIVNEFLQTFMEEGKYPERQAYNKEGWLVTFPSKEYRDAAIKKKTHFTSDPTHGKGGMNLYYKKKGKQKRQTQQATTATKAPDENVPQVKSPEVGEKPQPSAQKTPEPKDSGQEKVYSDIVDDEVDDGPKSTPKPATEPTAKEPSDTPDATTPPEKQTGAEAPTPSVPPTPPEPPEPDYEELSKRFVAEKHWTLTPFGEYRDTQGNSMAVVGLSGEIVPIKSNDREEYKIFAEKNIPLS